MSFNNENDNCLQHKDILNKLCKICEEREEMKRAPLSGVLRFFKCLDWTLVKTMRPVILPICALGVTPWWRSLLFASICLSSTSSLSSNCVNESSQIPKSTTKTKQEQRQCWQFPLDYTWCSVNAAVTVLCVPLGVIQCVWINTSPVPSGHVQR